MLGTLFEDLIRKEPNKIQFLKVEKVIYSSEFSYEDFVSLLIDVLTEEEKVAFLKDKELINKYRLKSSQLSLIIASLSGDMIKKLLKDKKLVLSLVEPYYLPDFLIKIDDETKRLQIAKEYDLAIYLIANIVCSCSDEKKRDILLNEEYEFDEAHINCILSKFEIQNLILFLEENGSYLKQHRIKVFELVKRLEKDKQIEFANKIDELRISLDEKLKTLVCLSEEAKKQIDRSRLNDRYIQALDMPILRKGDDQGFINLDLDGDLSQYEGFDELIRIRPQQIPLENYDILMRLIEVCPNLCVCDNIRGTKSTGQEFINAENWINDVISQIPDEWTDLQKVAYIDYRVGKKISYSPDFETEVFDLFSARSLWKIIDSGYGICNGIAQVEKYILERIGIEAQLVGGIEHEFLVLPNVAIPRSDGSVVIGKTIVDPTWNLASHRYNAYPNLFAISYKQAREFDMSDGEDIRCHLNPIELSDELIGIEETELRKIYASIGLAKEDGTFQIYDMMSESDAIAQKDIPLKQKIEEQLSLLTETHPDFYKCQNSTMAVLHNLLYHENMNYKKIVVNRVYAKNDKDKNSIVYVYCVTDNDEELFFVADPRKFTSYTQENNSNDINSTQKVKFTMMSLERFIAEYECYKEDIEKANGKRPWEMANTRTLGSGLRIDEPERGE